LVPESRSASRCCCAAAARMWCPSATANHFRTAAYWLTFAVRAAISQTDPLAKAELAIFRERLIRVGARVIEHTARLRRQWPTGFPEGALFRALATACRPDSRQERPQTRAFSIQTLGPTFLGTLQFLPEDASRLRVKLGLEIYGNEREGTAAKY
jgi:hypothetical protein